MNIARRLLTYNKRFINKIKTLPTKQKALLTFTAAGCSLFTYYSYTNQFHSSLLRTKLNNFLVQSPLTAKAEDIYEEISIGDSSNFIEGTMKQIQIGEDEKKDNILVVRLDGKLYACGAKCAHFGAPLVSGLLFEDRVYCPWHLA